MNESEFLSNTLAVKFSDSDLNIRASHVWKATLLVDKSKQQLWGKQGSWKDPFIIILMLIINWSQTADGIKDYTRLHRIVQKIANQKMLATLSGLDILTNNSWNVQHLGRGKDAPMSIQGLDNFLWQLKGLHTNWSAELQPENPKTLRQVIIVSMQDQNGQTNEIL